MDSRVQRYVSRHPRVRYFHAAGRGKTKAIHAGMAHAKGDIIAFTDDDCLVKENWLETIERSFSQGQHAAVFGQTLPYEPTRQPGFFCPCTIRFRKKSVVRSPRYHTTIGYGNNMAFRKEVLDEIGLPKVWLGPGSVGANAEDAELALRTLLSGKHIVREPKLMVYHDRWLSPEDMRRQQGIYERGEAACYGYFALQGHSFARKVIKRGFLNKLHALKEVGKALFRRRWDQVDARRVLDEMGYLIAYGSGCVVAAWFFMRRIF